MVIEHRDFVLIEDFQIRTRHLILLERSNCLQNVRVVELTDDGFFDNYHYISFSELVYSVCLGAIPEESADLTKHSMYDTNIVRYTYSNFIQPKQVVDYNMDTRQSTIIHEQTVLSCGGVYNPDLYAQRRLFATGIDGTAIPISLVYRKDLLNKDDQPNPCLLYGYGAYGFCLSPIFNSNRLSLLDRGFIYALGHIRGGNLN
jgi:oligopeptidase B